MKAHLLIRKLDYLKTPLFDWTFKNQFGGSFSNSGQHRTLKACVKHARRMLSNEPQLLDMPVRIEVYYGWDDQESMVKTCHDSYLAKLLPVEDRK